MLQRVQQFLQIDDTVLRFLAWYWVIGALLVAANFVWRRRRGPRPSVEKAARGAPPPVAIAALQVGHRFVRFVADLPVTPNQITVIGFVLVACNCLVFVYTRDRFSFGAGLVAAVLFDTLDGQVARIQGTTSRYGAYLDAVVDRYQEVIIFLTLAEVLDQWLPAFLVVSGSLIVSYNKARVALEIPIDNKSWPDLMEKPIRLTILIVGLMFSPVIPWFQPLSMWMLAGMTHFTALQRFTRARFRIADAERVK